MTFSDLLQQEIQTQGISVAEVSKASGISKGAIYNILNGTTEEERIRPSTRHALARGCQRVLEIDADGTHRFVSTISSAPADVQEPEDATDLRVGFSPARPFRAERHLADVFNWLNGLEEEGRLAGLAVVDRVYQKKDDFLSLVVENHTTDDLKSVEIPISIAYDDGPNETFGCKFSHVLSGGRAEMTVQVAGGPPYTIFVQDGQAVTTATERVPISTQTTYRHRG